ncbi:MAG: endolytic transglycosylase MltG [Streptococcaceae bacterium]|nr:endolytic transglycosylase MltG [Streptococcaceae bacterium]
MAHDSNSGNSFENFFNEAFGSETKSESRLRSGAPVFADQKVPDDILETAQQAMIEQGSATNTEPHQSTQNEENSSTKSDSTAVSSSKAIEKDKTEEDSAHSLKISKVRFIDNLPKKKIKSMAASSSGSDQAQSKSTIPPKPAASTTENHSVQGKPADLSKSIAQQVTSSPEDNFKELPVNEKPQKAAPSESHSFRDEIMARLKAETESYAQTESKSDPTDPELHFQRQNARTTPPLPPSVDEESSARKKSPEKLPSKADFLAAAGAKPKNMPKQVASQLGEGRIASSGRKNPPAGNYSATEENYNRTSRSDRKQYAGRKTQQNKRNKQSKIHIGRSIVIILLVLVLALGGFGYFYVQNNLKAVNPKDKTAQVIHIPESTSSKGVAQILKRNNLIRNSTVFSIYTKMNGLSNFKSGYYSLNKSMTPTQIATALEKGGSATSPAEGKITIPEGYTIEQMATAFTINAGSKTTAKTPFSSDDFLNVVKDPAFIAEMTGKYPQLFANLPAADSGVKYQLEGYLFPATYTYNSKDTARNIVEQMIVTMDKTLQPYYAQLPDLGLDVNSLLSLAALVEKEANSEEDRKNVADVFLKRLNEGWTLGSNVALLYAEGKLGTAITAEEDKNLDTTLDSPFNLYQNTGVGPGPIDSPSAMSIAAVINHTANPYYYFVADPSTGTIYFAQTEAEQQANEEEYLN